MAALARSVLRYSARHEAAASDSFADHVINGLTDNPKWLSAKYFYDAAGSDLFEEITRLPEYYPTRTELKILADNARAIAACIPLAAALVEFGTGSTRKARILLDAAPQVAAYVPVDISAEFLAQEAAAVRRDLPQVAVLPVAADFTRDFDLPAQTAQSPARRLLPRLHDRQFRAAGRGGIPPSGRTHSGCGRDHDRRRRPHQGRGGAQRGL